MQPSFALTYNSRSGNGIAGLGWSLSGASSIHRCPKTVAQDGSSGAVVFDGTDRLCLDGQRLVATSGSYGLAGTTYRTEVDTFAKVTQNGASLARGAAASSMDPLVVTDTWVWDPVEGDGLLASLTRTLGSTQNWNETYAYDMATKRMRSRKTTIAQASAPFLTQYQYDAYYGREKSVTYPSGFTAWKQYGGPNGDFGDLTALSDGVSLAPLWGLYQANEYRKPTQEQYGYGVKAVATYAHSNGEALTQACWGWRFRAASLGRKPGSCSQ